MLKSGEIISGIYIIEEKIGSGGSGIIYRAYHLRLRKNVVIKQIRQSIRGRIAERAEVDILKNLKHSYIPQVYDFLEYDVDSYSVMEYIQGKSLADELKKRKRFSQKRVIRWSIQICEALSYLHNRRVPIVHCDIKPDNIMLDEDDNICLIDFNVSILLSEDTSTIGFTEAYSSPEQASLFNIIDRMNLATTSKGDQESTLITKTNFLELNSGKITNNISIDDNNSSKKVKHRIDVRTDIYSLGASMYHLLFGEKPESFNTEATKYSKFNIKPELKQIINKAMNQDLEIRYKNVDDMLSDLRKISL